MKFFQVILACFLIVGCSTNMRAQQLMPGDACLLPNGQVLLASSSYHYFYTQKQLVLSFYNLNGQIQNKLFFTVDTLSIEKISGVFLHNDTTLIVFCVFASINNYTLPKHWGYVTFNTKWQLLNYSLYSIWFSPDNFNPNNDLPYMINHIRMKKSSDGGYYGNVAAQLNYNQYPVALYLGREFFKPSYNNLVRFSPDLELLNNYPDTIINLKGFGGLDYTRSVMNQSLADLTESDTTFLAINTLNQTNPGQVYIGPIDKDSFKRVNHARGAWGVKNQKYPINSPNDDTIQVIDNCSQFFYATKLSSNSNLIGMIGHFFQQRKVNGTWINRDTGNFFDLERGFILKFNDTGGVINYVYDIPIDSISFLYVNNPARQKCLDFFTPDNIYFAQTEDISSFFLPQAWNSIWVMLVDSNLNKKWVKRIRHPNSNIPNREYIQEHLIAQTIIATPDGGCLVFANIAYTHFVDTTYIQDSAFGYLNPYWQTIVYKFMPDGSMFTNNHEYIQPATEVIVYPNPASSHFYIDWPKQTSLLCQLFNLQGQSVNTQRINTPNKIDVIDVPSGIYYLKLTDDENKTVVKKVIINR